MGTKPKFWFSEAGVRLLFKAEERGTGEDWAEKVACHLCELLGLPHVHYDLAEEYDGESYIRPGVICQTCVPEGWALVLGNQLMVDRDPNYPARRSKYRVREHTVEAVVEVVSGLAGPPPEWTENSPPRLSSALDFLVGYVMLDAWIANQDRHHENWAALRGEGLHLAPTFDHGASLARNVSDEERKERLGTRDRNRTVAAFASRARSAFYARGGAGRPLGTLEAFSGFARHAAEAARVWLDRLASVGSDQVSAVLDEIPNRRMSKIAKLFTQELLRENQNRLLYEVKP